MSKREEFVKNLEASTYTDRLLKSRREELLEEIKTLDKGTPDGFKRHKEIEDELSIIRLAIILS